MGGSIPLMNILKNKFPSSSFLVVGILGPEANEHGPNESLDIAYTKKLICCLTQILA